MTIQSNLRVPFVAAEFDNSRAEQGAPVLTYRGLLIGQKSTGAAAANSLQKVTSADQVATLCGRGSMLHRQAKAWFAANKETELYIGVLADNGAGTAAAGTITVTGPATAEGTIALYLGGDLVQVAVASGDTANTIAAAINAAINAAADLPVTSSVSTNVVTVTFRHKGTVGNDFDIRVNYQDGEALPTGVSLALVQLTGGATNPVLTSLIAAMGDIWFHIIAHPYTDATSLTALETELADRDGPTRMISGQAFTAKSDTVSNMGTLGNGRNSRFNSIVGANASPTPAYEVGANVAAVAAKYGAADPARPFQTLPLVWVKAPAESARYTLEERNLLLYDGISTLSVGAGGVVQIDRLITTYKTNGAGAADTSYLDVTTGLTLMYARYSFRTRWAQRYPRHKLAPDGTRVGPGQAVLTPKIAKAECVLWFRDLEEKGLFTNGDQFKRDLVVAINGSDPNRLDILLPPDLINALIVTAATIQFRL
jgi:phage tail sheath gpL-like